MVTTAAARTREYLGPVARVAGAKAFGGVSMVALNVWIARQMTPAEYGVFAIAVTALLLLDGVVGAALDAAVIRTAGASPGAAPTGAELAGVALKAAAGGLLLAVLLAGAAVAAPGIGRTAALAAIGGTGLLVHRSVLVYLQLRERFGRYAAADLAQTGLRCALIVLLPASAYTSAVGPLAMYALAPWAVAALAVAAGLGRGALRGRAPAWNHVRAVSRAAGMTLATTGVGAIVARLDLLLIGAAGSAREAGLFAAASTFALVPTWIGAYIAPALTGRILPSCRVGRLQALLGSVQRRVLVLAGVGLLAGIAIAPAVVDRLFPPDYGGVVPVLRILLVAGAAGFITFPLVLHTLLFLSPRTYLVMDLVSLPVLVPLYIFTARRFGAVGVAWVSTASAVVKACVAQYAAAGAARRADANPAAVAVAV